MKKYINREAEKQVLCLAKSFPVIMITGPRQVGKTTMLSYTKKKMEKNINYVSLDNINDRMLANEDPELFLETYKIPLIIDEFQYAPKLLSYIKIIVDNKRLEELKNEEDSNGLFFLTGSQSFLSMREVTESLAGRVGILDLYGLSTREINENNLRLFSPNIEDIKRENNSNISMKKTFERIFRGSYPEVYKDSSILLGNYFESYIKTYIERDIRDLINIKDEVKFMKFMVSVAARTGQELNLTEICNDAEISVPTASDWLSILVNSGLVFLLEPYSTNIIKRVVKRPKLYFMDTGLACYLTKYPNAEILENSAYSGHIFETYVIAEIIKSYANNGLNAKRYLYYYRDSNRKEIDLIIEKDNKLYPVEIKKSKSPNKECIKNFDVLNASKKIVGNGIVFCMIDKIYPIDKNNYYVPISYI